MVFALKVHIHDWIRYVTPLCHMFLFYNYLLILVETELPREVDATRQLEGERLAMLVRSLSFEAFEEVCDGVMMMW